MVDRSGILYVVHDETVIPCEHDHRVIEYVTLDKSKAEEFCKKHYTLKIAEIPLDTQTKIKEHFGVIEGLT